MCVEKCGGSHKGDVHPRILITTGKHSPYLFFLSLCLPSLPAPFFTSFYQLPPRILRDYLHRSKSTVMRKKFYTDNGFFLRGVLKLALQKIEAQ